MGNRDGQFPTSNSQLPNTRRWELGVGGWKLTCITLALVVFASAASAQKDYTVKGMVLRVDRAKRSFVVSHEKIVGLMESMTMPFDVRDVRR